MTPPDKPGKGKAGEICETCPRNFIVVLGAPGKYHTGDRDHDRTWLSYFVTLKAYLENEQDPPDNEIVHVLVYKKGYDDRFNDDDNFESDDPWSAYLSRDAWRRNEHAEAVKDKLIIKRYWHKGTFEKNVTDYYSFMRKELKAVANAKKFDLVYSSINEVNDVNNYANRLKDNSITRLWFIGHAVDGELWLTLDHGTPDDPAAPVGPEKRLTIRPRNLQSIEKQKVFKASTKFSRFIGCNTATVTSEVPKSIIEAWHEHSSLNTLDNVTIHFKHYEDLAKPSGDQKIYQPKIIKTAPSDKPNISISPTGTPQ